MMSSTPAKPRDQPHAPIFPPPGRWVWWQHGPALLLLLGLAVAVWFATGEVSSFAGRRALDGSNAMYLRSALAVGFFGLAVIIRGQPWWHTLACTVLAFGEGLRVAQGFYSPAAVPMPWGLLTINVGLLIYAAVLAIRPSVYEQRDRQAQRIQELEQENAALRQRRP